MCNTLIESTVNFTANAETWVYADPTPFASDGATHYVATARQAVQGDFVSCNEL